MPSACDRCTALVNRSLMVANGAVDAIGNPSCPLNIPEATGYLG